MIILWGSGKMKANIIQIGNSRGIRLPKTLLQECGLDEDSCVEITTKKNQIIIKPCAGPRTGWAEAFQEMARAGDDRLLEVGNLENEWDEEEWEWR